METTNTNAANQVATNKRAQDVKYIYEASDQVNGIYVMLHMTMRNYGYPSGALSNLAVAVSELSNELARAASFIINPDAEDIVDGVKERIKCGID